MDQRLAELVEELTTSGEQRLEPGRMKELKNICKYGRPARPGPARGGSRASLPPPRKRRFSPGRRVAEAAPEGCRGACCLSWVQLAASREAAGLKFKIHFKKVAVLCAEPLFYNTRSLFFLFLLSQVFRRTHQPCVSPADDTAQRGPR